MKNKLAAVFLAVCEQTPVDYYPIPYRCLYSRNVGNLFMVGRDISVSHIALGTTRVMRTCAMEGEVVGKPGLPNNQSFNKGHKKRKDG